MDIRPQFIMLLAALTSGCAANTPRLSPAAPPPDRPVHVTSASEVQRLERAIVPYVEEARRTYPDAKRRFQAGLPSGHYFSVTVRLSDQQGRTEIVFMQVKDIADGVIRGVIANDVTAVAGYEAWQEHSVREAEILDWTILRPDGTEEGNVVGKFLDTWEQAPPE